jgi:hypothetical protein
MPERIKQTELCLALAGGLNFELRISRHRTDRLTNSRRSQGEKTCGLLEHRSGFEHAVTQAELIASVAATATSQNWTSGPE